MPNNLTIEQLRSQFYYNPVTGWFTNRTSRGRAKAGKRAGERAGAHAHSGYRRMSINYTRFYEHHLAWFYIFEEWPTEIDHIDGDPSNNAITNLRICNRSLNNCNRSQQPASQSGLRGAYLDPRNLQWFSKIQFGGQVKFLGNFNSAEEAHEAFEIAAKELHGDFYLDHS